MSMGNSLVCVDCAVEYHLGKMVEDWLEPGSGLTRYWTLADHDQRLKAIELFLIAHRSHELRVVPAFWLDELAEQIVRLEVDDVRRANIEREPFGPEEEVTPPPSVADRIREVAQRRRDSESNGG